MEGQILSKLFDMGVLNSQAKLSDVDNKLTVAAFCRRRLAVIMVMAKMAETVSAVRDHLRFSFPVLLAHALSLIFAVLLFFLSRLLFFFSFFSCSPSQAVKFVEQGHVRVGPDTVTDPAYLVTRYVNLRPRELLRVLILLSIAR